MCGRTACSLAAEQIRRACAYRDGRGRRRDPDWRDGDRNKYKPSFNKSPHSHCPVLVSRKHFHKDADSTEQLLAAMRWGLIPSWFRESDPSKMLYNTSNCRSDGMLHKNSYKEDGEEWQGRRLLTMAGLFDHWAPPGGGEDLYTYTVITVDASKAMDWIHDRMPAILDGEEAVRMWLDYGQVPAMEALKLIHPTERIALHPVSTVVNNSRNDFLDCIKPIELGVKKEVKPTASSKLMMNWLQNPSPKKEEASPGSQHTVKVETPKKSSVGLMQMWLQKTEEPSAKKLRTS
ncbi:hypothetical protein chiPu_0009942 [Chiloscyllium punctatum]|uniref:Abasic site processing protein HMCES n=1 Tax=Chiloscyllium punctatum TaxID=137246 RepID=A0A401SM50_CHIPU|nr:hypothetical protein [Chiloscyllium punctatum]